VKVLVVGYFPSNETIYTYAQSFYKTFKYLKHTCDYFNYRARLAPFTHVNNILNNLLLIKKIAHTRPDLIFFIKSENVFPKTLKIIRQKYKSIIVNFYPDNPFTFWNNNSNANVLNALPYYNHFFIWSHELIPILTSAGACQTHYFPFAFDQELFNQELPTTNIDYHYDVSFIGTWEPERERWLTHVCQKLPKINLALWGNQWQEHISTTHILHKYIKGTAIYNHHMIEICRKTKINLNFIRTQNLKAHNMRTFEIPAAYSFLLTQRTHDQAKLLFTEDKNIACFDSPAELVKKITYYLTHDTEREEIKTQSYNHVQKYTLEHEIKKALKLIAS
jgi:spore maturation protein CgeB